MRVSQLSSPSVILGIAGALLITGSSASAQIACCLPEGCDVAEGESACTDMGGVTVPFEDCGGDPCGIGACCAGSNCVQVDAYNCITNGRDYQGSGTLCADDPCNIVVGACCIAESCSEVSETDCSSSGGAWLGVGSDCGEDTCSQGACCTPGECGQSTGYECASLGGTFWPSADCSEGGACDIADDCPADSLYGQPRTTPEFFEAYTSELDPGIQRWDNFFEVPGAIESLRWFGLDLWFTGTVFEECDESNPEFEISFHEDNGGEVGDTLCSYIVTADRIETGVFYDFVELIEYQVDLPEPCVLTNGWISIFGFGDSDCWFLWLRSLEGDGQSYCEGCSLPVEDSDMSFCLLGSAGGLFGACCDETSGSCTDDTEISDCTAPATRFVADQECSQIDPSCTAVTGACCMGDGTCSVIGELACAAAGGDWLGGDVGCEQCPVLGACCQDEATCALTTEEGCSNEGYTWAGPGTTCEQCPAFPTCPPDSLFGQDPDQPLDFTAYTSEETPGLYRYEDFDSVAGAVESLTWWGVDLDFVESGNYWSECEEFDPTFVISFHENAAGVPGDLVCTETITATRTPTGLFYLGTELNEYSVTLAQPCAMTNGFVSMVGLGDPECLFLWMSAGTGGSYCDGCIPPQQDDDLSVCLHGTVGGVFGACCDDSSGDCSDGVEITGCLEGGQRFVANSTCALLDPPCGVITGACCANDVTCSESTEADCLADGSNWLGANSLCSECPCITPCPAGGAPEGEAACTDDNVDVFNSGCEAEPPVFEAIPFCQDVCATGGVYETGGELITETDWYEFVLEDAADITITVNAEFPVTVWLMDGTIGCPGGIMLSGGANECEPVVLQTLLGYGTYWIVVFSASASDLAYCGAHYTARVSRTAQCIEGDINGDGVVDEFDFGDFQDCFTGPDGGPIDLICSPADFDSDGDVDLVDFAGLQQAYTPGPS